MRRFLAIGVVLAASLTGPPAAAAPAAVPAQPADMITLVTGDQVLLGGAGGAMIRPAKGRERVRFLTKQDVRGDVHVTPHDALPMLRSGHLDARLFNVSALLKHGFGDAARPDIPLIVSGLSGVRTLTSIDASAVTVAKDSTFWRTRQASRIWLDGPVRATLDRSVPQIGAPAAWQAGLTGKDTKVAVLDTGIDATHPDLADAVIDARDFSNSTTGPADKYGHGTHVASIVTGKNGKYTGVAPDTKLLNGKVLGDRGNGNESNVIAGMQWAAAAGAQVINMSLGSDLPSDGADIVSQAVNTLTAQYGSLFVVASGNLGGIVGSPAAADAALTVGAVDSADVLAPFSSRGPRSGDDAIKPDITAPGVDIVAAKAKGSFLDGKLPNVGDNHFVMSGTSMAAPHVAGAAAILAGKHPAWKATDLKAALMNSAKARPDLSVFEQGAGRVDVAQAVTRTVHATPASISNGIVPWPHNDDKPINNVLIYHNSGTAPISVTPAADVRDPAGKAAPAGMFTVTPATVVVQPGSQARVTITIDTTIDAADGIFSGVVAADGVRTPISVTREAESYNAKLNFIGFDGKPTGDYDVRIVDSAQPVAYQRYDASGNLTVRLPRGRYFVEAQMLGEGGPMAILTEPDVDLSGDVSLTLDSREAEPAGLVLDRATQQSAETFVELSRTMSWGVLNSSVHTSFDDVAIRPSKTVLPGQFRYSVGGRFVAGTYLYNVRGDVDGRVPADPVVKIRDRDLVKVRSVHAATQPGTKGRREYMIERPLPYTLDEFYSPGVPWSSSFSETTPSSGAVVQNIFTSAPRGFSHDGTERWNHGVFGPDLPDNPGRPFRYASRLGDTLIFQIPAFSDSGPDREGFSAHTGSTKLFHGNEEINQTPRTGVYEVPAGPATYRLHSETTRDRTLSSKITVDWTFKSDTVTEPHSQPLPMMAIRFAPPLDTASRTPRILPTILPITISTNNLRTTAQPTSLKVSHDKGATWRPAPFIPIGNKWYTILLHPPTATTVSLQATAQDTAGNTVTQTIIDAFLLKG